eukprot:GHVU01167944.1.p1 GENE.GHVU01167944.1~~GHVU01167944.1.p1  ORF type:complete len:250 (+),score=22.71 GHVU01167944.1:126-875(+)
MAKASLVLLLSTVIVAAAAVGETADRHAPTKEKMDKLFTTLLVKRARIVPYYIVTDSTTKVEFEELFQKLDKAGCWRHLESAEKPNLNDILERGFTPTPFSPILNIEQLPRAQKAVTECDEGSEGFKVIKKMFWDEFSPGYDFNQLKEDFSVEKSGRGPDVVPKVKSNSQACLWALKLLKVATNPDVQKACKRRQKQVTDLGIALKSPITLVPGLKDWHHAVVQYVRDFIQDYNDEHDLSDPETLRLYF